ncbi:MAG: ester cyclase [Gammaproteobacteria bacterium]|nr:ester cyclase [Gammaproteobacteria bacterium]
MPSTDNKALVLEHLDLSWNKGDFGKIKDFLSKRFFYKTTFTDEILDTKQYIDFINVLREAIPDLSVELELIMADKQHVMTQVSFLGAVVKAFYGIPASNKIITFPAVSIWEIDDGKIISLDTLIDMSGLERQIGTTVRPQIPLNIRSKTI